MQLLQKTIAKHNCTHTHVQNTSARHDCKIRLQNTVSTHDCKTQLQNAVVNHNCKTRLHHKIATRNRKSRLQKGFKSKTCPKPSRVQHFIDFYWRKRARRRGIEKATAPKSDSKLTFLRATLLRIVFKNVLPTGGGEHIFEKMGTDSEVKHKCK